MENWLEIKFWFNDFVKQKYIENHKKILLRIFKPIICDNRLMKNIDTYHFFFEPSPDALLRLEIKGNKSKDQIRKVVEEKLKQINRKVDFIKEYKIFDDYLGEKETYGGGWNIAKKFFDVSCKFALANLDDGFDKGVDFNAEKLIHCFCNPNFLSYQNEIIFYIKRLRSLGINITLPNRD